MENYSQLNDGLNDFILKKVYPKVEVLEYTLRLLSSCLSGEIQEKFISGLVLVVMVNLRRLN